nr:MAG TPA: hypothetical protein [Caudoviricetes sp.]
MSSAITIVSVGLVSTLLIVVSVVETVVFSIVVSSTDFL